MIHFIALSLMAAAGDTTCARDFVAARSLVRQDSHVCTPLLGAARGDSSSAGPDPLLDHLVGTWVLRGRMAGQNVVHDISARWVLNHEYVELRETPRSRSSAGASSYEAIVYIGQHPVTHEFAVLWMDNTAYGAFVPEGTGHGMADADSIPFVFADSSGINFRNTFVYDRARDSWQWHLDNVDAKGNHPFARVTLTRVKAPPPRAIR